MGVINNLRIVGLQPPVLLPTIVVTVKVGQNVIINKGMIQSFEPYLQMQNMEIGSIKILGTESTDWRRILKSDNNLPTEAYFMNYNDRIYKMSAGASPTNAHVTSRNIEKNRFRVFGVRVSQTPIIVTYVATAISGTEVESPFSTDAVGRIIINVVSAVNNKPNALKGGEQDVVIGGMTKILGSTVTLLYADPENDAPYKVRIDGLPYKGKLYYYGEVIENTGVEIPYQHVLAGALMYLNEDGEVGAVDEFTSTVSDIGSQQYY